LNNVNNQHKVKGYRTLNDDEIKLMNEAKAHEQTNLDMVKKINNFNMNLVTGGNPEDIEKVTDAEANRWAAMGRTDIETAMMRLTRAVAKPVFYKA